jgi:hypothetical protein
VAAGAELPAIEVALASDGAGFGGSAGAAGFWTGGVEAFAPGFVSATAGAGSGAFGSPGFQGSVSSRAESPNWAVAIG